MEVVKDLDEATKKTLAKEKNLDEVLDAIQEAIYAIRKEEFNKAYHLLDMAAIGISMEKISIIKKDVQDEKSN